MNEKIRKSLIWGVILSESSHLFCCVLPTVVSLAGLLAGFGMVVALPPSFLKLHEFLHEWELPMIAVSGLILVLGWVVIHYSDRMDCHSTGCAHDDCAPRKDRAHLVLKIATVLFVFNLLVYVFVHRSGVLDDMAQHQHHHESEHMLENGHQD